MQFPFLFLFSGGVCIRRIYRLLFGRLAVIFFLLFLQITCFLVILFRFSHLFFYVSLFLRLLSSAVVIAILLSDRILPDVKSAWAIPILLFPLFGGLFYLISDMGSISKHFRKKLYLLQARQKQLLGIAVSCTHSFPKPIERQVFFLKHAAHFPCYKNTCSRYLSPGESFFSRLLEELKKAEHTIFLEFFIIANGFLWDSVLAILKRKAQQGVDVRIIYDDAGCLCTLPHRYPKELEAYGIRCRIFSPLHPAISRCLNSRDHRKLAIIDGHTAFTGGINLSDEYINLYHIHGHWKDAGLLIHGEAVWSFTAMFLSMWEYLGGEEKDPEQYLPRTHHPDPFAQDGWYIPFGSDPCGRNSVSAYCLGNILHRAEKYLYLDTPYLIVDNETADALCLAAKSGVDVRIITPGVPDKWYVHMMTRSFYPLLIESGVRIYEYTPGFVHAKCLVCDDTIAVVGSINLDYRSLYQQFECAVWMYQSRTVADVKTDFLETLSHSREITLKDCRSAPWYVRLLRTILRIFAPLM